MRLALLALCLAQPVAAQDEDLRTYGGDLFQTYCADCHGEDARGEGPMQLVLPVDVPDLTQLSEREGGFPHYEVVTKIDGRSPIMSHGTIMPTWGELFDTPESAFVRTEAGQPIVTSVPIAALVAWLEGVQE